MINPYGLEREFLNLAVLPEEAPTDGRDEVAILTEDEFPEALDLFAASRLVGRAEIEEFVLRLARVGRTIQYELTALEAAEADLQARIKRRRRRLDGLRSWLRSCMEGHGLRSVKDERVTVWGSANSQPAVRPTDELLLGIPDEYIKATLVMPRSEVPEGYEKEIKALDLDRARILAQLKEIGEIPPGVEVERGSHVSWR